MLLRCPSCGESFPVVGRCRAPCPFCATLLDIEIVRPSAETVEIRAHLAHRDGAGDRYVRVSGGSRSPAGPRASGRTRTWTPAEPEAPVARARRPRDAAAVAAAQATADAFDEARLGGKEIARLRRDAPRSRVPWEEPGWLPVQWARTVWMVMVSPRRFFGALTADRWGGAPSFAAIQLLSASLATALPGPLPAPGAPIDPATLAAVLIPALFVVLGAALFFVLLVTSFHACAEASLKRRVRWAGVGRVAAYGLAPMVFSVIPTPEPFEWLGWLGWGAAVVGAVGLHAIGLRQLLDLEWRTATVTAAFPWLSVLAVLAMSFS